MGTSGSFLLLVGKWVCSTGVRKHSRKTAAATAAAGLGKADERSDNRKEEGCAIEQKRKRGAARHKKRSNGRTWVSN
jgi:hypothetical protein